MTPIRRPRRLPRGNMERSIPHLMPPPKEQNSYRPSEFPRRMKNGDRPPKRAPWSPPGQTESSFEIRRKIREALDHFVNCYWCGCDLPHWLKSRTIDHLVPLSRGGDHTIKNCVVACESCNKFKGDKTAIEFREFIDKNLDDSRAKRIFDFQDRARKKARTKKTRQ